MTVAGDDLAARFAGTAFRSPFRPYQQRALDAVEAARAGGDDRYYLTMPPGSGKTVVGLEVIRRLGRPALVLGPTTAIAEQWLAEWSAFEPRVVAAAGTPDLAAPVTVLTYQSIAVIDTDADLEAVDPAGTAPIRPRSAHERRRARLLVARGGDRDAVLGLLHENGRAIVERLAAGGPLTLVLDECHHLLDLWGQVLAAVIDALPAGSCVVGLTATPPSELGARQQTLYRRLFGGHADFEIVTPAVVKDGHLAPYAELAVLVPPTPAEETWIARQQERFDALRLDLLDPAFATVPFGAWFATRILRPRSADGAPVAWATIERDDPDLARAALRRRWSLDEPVPAGAHLREEHRRPPDAPDWIAMLDAYASDVLVPSAEPVDAIALEQVRRALPAIGYVLTRRGVRRATSVVDRVLGVSAAKAGATARILAAEAAVLGDGLRAVVLCDFERATPDTRTATAGVLDPAAGSAAGALRALLADPGTAGLDPVLVTGRTVACARSTAVALVAFADRDPATRGLLDGWDALAAAGDPGAPTAARPAWDEPVEVRPPGPAWSSRRWVPLVTAFFEAGGSRCLVGTRALLGEGWNSRRANVLVDLGAATTSVSMQQVRGRTLRLDPSDPAKVAHNWDVVCVAERHIGGSADYERFVRKHRHYFAPNATGEIESGVSHVDPSLSPYGPPSSSTFEALEAAMLARAGLRGATRSAWRIGEAYRDAPVATLRVRLDRTPGLPGRRLLRGPAPADTPSPRVLAAGGAVLAVGAAALGVAGGPLPGVTGLAMLGVGAGIASLRAFRDRLAALDPADTLEDLGRALADGLAAGGLLPAGVDAGAVRIAPQPDGYYRCVLDGAGADGTAVFAEALDELLSPLWDPRWIIPRRVEPAPDGSVETLSLLVRRGLGGGRGVPQVWHQVPQVLTRRRDRVAAFETAWRRWVSPEGRAIPADDPRAEVVLALRMGDDPFGVETQLRTLWT